MKFYSGPLLHRDNSSFYKKEKEAESSSSIITAALYNVNEQRTMDNNGVHSKNHSHRS